MNTISRFKLRKHAVNILFTLPALILFAYIYIIPFIQGIPYSMTDWDGVNKAYNFVGLANYKYLLTNIEFLEDLWNTFSYTFFYMIGSNVIGLLLALAIYKSSKFNNFMRSLFFMPFVISMVTTAFIWSYIFTDVYSPLFNLPSPLGITKQAMIGIIIMGIWRDAGYCMIIYIAALQSVPLEYYEVAEIEGANSWNKFIKITAPMIMPAFTANLTLLFAWGIKLFDIPMAATSGGPGRATESIAMYVYNNIFGFMKAGYGQAAAIVMTLLLFIMSNLLTRFLRSKEVEA